MVSWFLILTHCILQKPNNTLYSSYFIIHTMMSHIQCTILCSCCCCCKCKNGIGVIIIIIMSHSLMCNINSEQYHMPRFSLRNTDFNFFEISHCASFTCRRRGCASAPRLIFCLLHYHPPTTTKIFSIHPTV